MVGWLDRSDVMSGQVRYVLCAMLEMKNGVWGF